MSDEQSIRDELVQILDDDPLFARIGYNHAERLADRLLGSPVIRRIQAEAWDQAVEEQRLLAPAHEAEVPRNPYIERGETA